MKTKVITCTFFPSIFLQGEMKMPVCIEDECNSELPPASLLFRTARQYAYGVLFSLAETQRRLERLALRKRAPFEGKASCKQPKVSFKLIRPFCSLSSPSNVRRVFN